MTQPAQGWTAADICTNCVNFSMPQKWWSYSVFGRARRWSNFAQMATSYAQLMFDRKQGPKFVEILKDHR